MQDLFIVYFVFLSFLSGSIPFSIIIGRLFLKEDIRDYGDGNPGAGNVWRAGGPFFGVLAIIFDMAKAYLPIYIAMRYYDFNDYSLMAVAIAPIAGHAFSPFLRFHGGKAVSSTYGTWLALNELTGILYMGATCGLFFLLQVMNGLSMVAGFVALLVYLYLSEAGMSMCILCLLNMMIVGYRHRKEFNPLIKLRPVFDIMLRRGRSI